jgi:hypothetical protein
MPKANLDQTAAWDFSWTAPTAAGTYTLFGAGNSVNLNGQSSGDRSSAATLDVMVVAATAATPTATPSPAPARTTGPRACVGDCDKSGTVTVNELVTGVDMALGTLPLEACPQFDANGDLTVEIDELVAAVDDALRGCET